jgi:hypothetical protein
MDILRTIGTVSHAKPPTSVETGFSKMDHILLFRLNCAATAARRIFASPACVADEFAVADNE